jgi:cell division protein FtsB
MVRRTRLRSIVIPVLFYLALGTASGYLVYNASTGDRGLDAKLKYENQTVVLKAELASLKEERDRWRRRVAGLSPASVDRDLLDEEAHAMLNRVGKDELVIMTGPQASR